MKPGISAIKTTLCIALAAGCAACGESGAALSPTGPSAIMPASLSQASEGSWSTSVDSRVPTIRVADGVSCPSDAPVVMVGGFGSRLDIEWSPIPKVSGYEVLIERLHVTNVWEPAGVVPSTSARVEWYGQMDSRYRLRVRSLRCGGVGQWSSWAFYTVNGPFVAPPAPPVVLLTNGSFESGLAGWSSSGNLVAVADDATYDVTHGTQAMSFNGGNQAPNGVLSQTFATTPGQTYTLAFDIGAMSFLNTDTMSMLVTVQGTGALLAQIVAVAAPGNGTNFASQNFVFVADSATATLTFQDTSATTVNVDLVLDNVRVTP